MERQIILEETYRRLNLAKKLTKKIQPSKTILLVGSVAYGKYYCVTPRSDLELISIIGKKDILENHFLSKYAKKYLSSGEADIYKKDFKEDSFGSKIETSVIFWTSSFFERMCNNIHFKFLTRFGEENLSQRKDISKRKIQLNGFHGNSMTFHYESAKTEGGYFTKYPIHTIKNNGLHYFAGVPIENLLSNPQVLAGDTEYIKENIHALWSILAERSRFENGPGENPFIQNLLLRKKRFPPSLLKTLDEKQNYYWHLSRTYNIDTFTSQERN